MPPRILHINEHGEIAVLLTRGLTTIIESTDFGLAKLFWSAASGTNYACRRSKSEGTVYLHRTVLERVINRPLVEGEVCDHVNGDVLDNRRLNLRLATPRQNQFNKGLMSSNTSGHSGVYQSRQTGKWVAQIKTSGRTKYLGSFADIADAIVCRATAEKQYFGEFSPMLSRRATT